MPLKDVKVVVERRDTNIDQLPQFGPKEGEEEFMMRQAAGCNSNDLSEGEPQPPHVMSIQ